MTGSCHIIGPAIQAVADGRELGMKSTANVGLVIFGFDADQMAEGGIGHKHFEKLRKDLGTKMVRTSDAANGLKLGLLS